MVTWQSSAVLLCSGISFELSARDGHAVVACTIITLFHLSYKIFVYKRKKLYTRGTTVVKEYLELFLAIVSKNKKMRKYNTQKNISVGLVD